jgi:hypothetical protein
MITLAAAWGAAKLQRLPISDYQYSSAKAAESGRKGAKFKNSFLQGFGSGSVSGSGSAWIRINLSFWIRIRIRIQIADPDPDPGGQKLPTKIEKSPEFSCF